jgi:rubrerythrin
MTQQKAPMDLARFDTDGALQETAAVLDGHTRGGFLRRAGVAAASLSGAGALIGALPNVASAQVPQSDVDILNFALTLEYLEAEFYKQASGAFRKGRLGRVVRLLAVDENAHVEALKKALGSAAVAKPRFDFGKTMSSRDNFLTTSFVLENTGVHAYLGQAGNIKTPAILAAAASIVTIEARHAAAIGLLANPKSPAVDKSITPDGPFDKPKTKQQILKAVAATGFIKS